VPSNLPLHLTAPGRPRARCYRWRAHAAGERQALIWLSPVK